MIHQLIKDLFASSVEHICSDISNYSIHPGIDSNGAGRSLHKN